LHALETNSRSLEMTNDLIGHAPFSFDMKLQVAYVFRFAGKHILANVVKF